VITHASVFVCLAHYHRFAFIYVRFQAMVWICTPFFGTQLRFTFGFFLSISRDALFRFLSSSSTFCSYGLIRLARICIGCRLRNLPLVGHGLGSVESLWSLVGMTWHSGGFDLALVFLSRGSTSIPFVWIGFGRGLLPSRFSVDWSSRPCSVSIGFSFGGLLCIGGSLRLELSFAFPCSRFALFWRSFKHSINHNHELTLTQSNHNHNQS